MQKKRSRNNRSARKARSHTHAHTKYKYGNRHLWGRGYYVSTVGGNKQAVQKYIQNQEKEDLISDQISTVEYYDPFENWLKSNAKKKDENKK